MSKVHNVRIAHIQNKRHAIAGATAVRFGMTIDGPVYQEIYEGHSSIDWYPLCWLLDAGINGIFFPYGVGQCMHQTRAKWGC